MTILDLRQQTGLSQSQFAREYHLNLNTLRAWEQNIYETPERFIFLIDRILQLENELQKVREVTNYEKEQ